MNLSFLESLKGQKVIVHLDEGSTYHFDVTGVLTDVMNGDIVLTDAMIGYEKQDRVIFLSRFIVYVIPV